MIEKYPDLYPDFGKSFVSRFWDESDDEILGYKGCSGEISGFISRLWEMEFRNFWNDNTFLKKDYKK